MPETLTEFAKAIHSLTHYILDRPATPINITEYQSARELLRQALPLVQAAADYAVADVSPEVKP